MSKMALVAGVISLLLGGLWLLHGLGLVHVRPILCFTDCAPVQVSSLSWATIGFLFVTAGVLATLFSLRVHDPRHARRCATAARSRRRSTDNER